VHIQDNGTGIIQDVISDGTGLYQSAPVPPGQYSVSVQAEGFATAQATGVVVDAAAHVTSNMKLQICSTSTNVTVKATPPILDTVDAEIGHAIDTRAAQDLPVNGCSVLALATLSLRVSSAVGATSEGFTNRGTPDIVGAPLRLVA
jgi:hypothetical protein